MKLTVRESGQIQQDYKGHKPICKDQHKRMYQAALLLNVLYFKWASGKSDSFYFYKSQSM